jgi:periplasmic divalent cation tolerance protein
MDRAVFVYTTYPSAVEAEKAGRSIVHKRLAACANIVPGMVSHYWWDDKVTRAEEVIVLFKTRSSLAGAVSDAIKEAHPYTTPGIVVIPLESVEANYLKWMMAETAPREGAK